MDSPDGWVWVVARNCVERLPRRERELVSVRYLFGFGEADIARALGLAPGTVARSLHDARARLRAALRDPETEESR